MNGPPVVSVIVIFLDEERFLQAAIDSVVHQTSPAWELLLIDDGSTDGSPEIARRSAALDPARVRYLTHEGGGNRGKSVSRNLGLREARGEYVAFLDGDDVFRPEKVERQSALLSAVTAAMVYGRTLYWHRWPEAPADAAPDFTSRLGVAPDRLYQAPQLLTMFLRDGGTVPCICGLTVRRATALEVGGFDETIQDLYEDQVFLAKICARFPVFVESGCWDQYRQHPDSTCQRAIARGEFHPLRPHRSRLAFLDWLTAFLDREQVRDQDLRRALGQALFPYRYPRLHRFNERALSLRRRVTRKLSSVVAHGDETSA